MMILAVAGRSICLVRFHLMSLGLSKYDNVVIQLQWTVSFHVFRFRKLGSIEQNLPQPFMMVFIGLSGRELGQNIRLG